LCILYRRIRAPFLAIINEFILKINDIVLSFHRTLNKDERAALNEKCAKRIQYVGAMMQKGANEDVARIRVVK